MAYFLLPRRALFGLGFDADFFGVDTIGPGECAGLQHELYSRKLPEVIKSSGIILAELKSVKCRTVKTNPSLRLPIFSAACMKCSCVAAVSSKTAMKFATVDEEA